MGKLWLSIYYKFSILLGSMVEAPKEKKAPPPVPKMRFKLEEGRWGSKCLSDIIKDAMYEDKNWNMMQDAIKKLKEEDEDSYWELLGAMNTPVEDAGDMMMDDICNQEDFEAFFRGLAKEE